MPLRVRCNKCEKIIYESNIIKSPQELYKKFAGKCPKCEETLSKNYEKIFKNIKIFPNEEK
jgi:NAD-dependent SIR2 family protein deacetylase